MCFFCPWMEQAIFQSTFFTFSSLLLWLPKSSEILLLSIRAPSGGHGAAVGWEKIAEIYPLPSCASTSRGPNSQKPAAGCANLYPVQFLAAHHYLFCFNYSQVFFVCFHCQCSSPKQLCWGRPQNFNESYANSDYHFSFHNVLHTVFNSLV